MIRASSFRPAHPPTNYTPDRYPHRPPLSRGSSSSKTKPPISCTRSKPSSPASAPPPPPSTIRTHVGAIAHLVERIVAETQQAVTHTGDEVLRARTEEVLLGLAGCRGRLLRADREAGGVGDEGALWAEVVGRLPPLAFEVARWTKELVQRVEGGGEGDEFRMRVGSGFGCFLERHGLLVRFLGRFCISQVERSGSFLPSAAMALAAAGFFGTHVMAFLEARGRDVDSGFFWGQVLVCAVVVGVIYGMGLYSGHSSFITFCALKTRIAWVACSWYACHGQAW